MKVRHKIKIKWVVLLSFFMILSTFAVTRNLEAQRERWGPKPALTAIKPGLIIIPRWKTPFQGSSVLIISLSTYQQLGRGIPSIRSQRGLSVLYTTRPRLTLPQKIL